MITLDIFTRGEMVIGRKELNLYLGKSRPITGANRYLGFRFILNTFGGLLKQFVARSLNVSKNSFDELPMSKVRRFIPSFPRSVY
jgi:hypothetical protein